MWTVSALVLVTQISDVDRRLYTVQAEIPSPHGSIETMVEVFVEQGLCEEPRIGCYYFANGSFQLLTESIYVLKAYTFTEAGQIIGESAPLPVMTIAGCIVKKQDQMLEVQCKLYSRLTQEDQPAVIKVFFRQVDWARFEKALWRGKTVHLAGWMESWGVLVGLGFSMIKCRAEEMEGSPSALSLSPPRAKFSPKKHDVDESNGAHEQGQGSSRVAGKRVKPE